MASDIPTFIASPIPQLLISNSIPSDDERDATHEFIGRLQNTITAIDGEMVYLRSLLEGKERERWAVHEVIHRHKAVLCPVRTLAPELLSEIFVHTIPSDTLDLYPVPEDFNPWKILLLVSQISRKWRDAALGTPRLWCTLRILFNSGSVVPAIYRIHTSLSYLYGPQGPVHAILKFVWIITTQVYNSAHHPLSTAFSITFIPTQT